MLATSLLRRKTFTGKNDKYAPMPERDQTLQLALKGADIYDVTGSLSLELRDQSIARMNRYSHRWNFYNGVHFDNPYDADGTEKLVLNYCEHVVNLSSDWLVAKGFGFSCPEGNEEIANLCNRVWEANNADALLWKLSQFGGITGDAFLYVTASTKDAEGNDLPRDKWQAKVTALNPAWVHPIWSTTNPETMASCLIQFPFTDAAGKSALFSVLITPSEITTWQNSEQVNKQPNPLGAVNVVHIPHQIVANSVYGSGEIDPIWRTNQKLNTTAGIIDRILKYHAEPTTIVYGITVSQLEKGANKCWSGLPVDGKVENLKLEGDLKATYDWFKQLKKEIAVKSEVPYFLLDSETFSHVSNTSGIAMQLLFQPLLSKTERRRVTYERGLLQANKLILLVHEKIIGDDLSVLADNPDAIYCACLDWTSPLPRDEQAELDTVIKKLNAKILSQAEAIRQVSNVKNVQRLILELAADKRALLAEARENAVAAQGGKVSFSSVFLASPFLSEDMEALAEEVGASSQQADDGEDA